MNYSTDFKSIKDEVSPEEWQTRPNSRLLPAGRQVWMTDPFITTSLRESRNERHPPSTPMDCLQGDHRTSLVKIDVEGNILAKPDTDYDINKSGYVIHGAIHKARPDAKCVLHTHTRAGVAVSAMKCGLLPLSQTSIRFHGHIGYHDYEGPAVDLDERERIVQILTTTRWPCVITGQTSRPTPCITERLAVHR
jgi:hypothetical protein